MKQDWLSNMKNDPGLGREGGMVHLHHFPPTLAPIGKLGCSCYK